MAQPKNAAERAWGKKIDKNISDIKRNRRKMAKLKERILKRWNPTTAAGKAKLKRNPFGRKFTKTDERIIDQLDTEREKLNKVTTKLIKEGETTKKF